MDMSDLNNKWSIKMNIERSRREYLGIRAQQEVLRRKYLENTGRLQQWEKEKQKRQFKRCNNTFGRSRLNAINRLEHRENGELVQVTTKEEIENAIMIEIPQDFDYRILLLC